MISRKTLTVMAALLLLAAAGCGSDPKPAAAPVDAAAGLDQGRAPDSGATADGAATDQGNTAGLDAGGAADTATDGSGAADSVSGAADGGTADPATVARYLGVWTYLSGGERLVCPGRADRTADPTGNTLTMKAGTGGAALEMASPSCGVRFAVSGDVASALPGQTCMSSQGAATLNYALDSFTFTLKDGTATEATSWTITFTDTAGTLRCTLTTSGALERS